MFNKVLLVGALISGAVANFDKFPKITEGALLAHAEIRVTYPDASCESVYGNFHTILKGFGNEDPAKGTYAIKELVDSKYIWTRRSDAYPYHETDDVGFTFITVGDDCEVKGKSISQFLPKGDKQNAYCSVWNVMKYAKTFINLKNGWSSYTPTDPDTECVAYPAEAFLQ